MYPVCCCTHTQQLSSVTVNITGENNCDTGVSIIHGGQFTQLISSLFSFNSVIRFYQSAQQHRNKWTSWRMCPPNMRFKKKKKQFLTSDCVALILSPTPPSNYYAALFFLTDGLMAACFTSLHQRRDASPPVCSCKQLRDGHGSSTETRHNTWVCWLSENKHSLKIIHNISAELITAFIPPVIIIGFYWPTPTSWLKCRQRTTPQTHEAVPLSTRDTTAWRTYALLSQPIDKLNFLGLTNKVYCSCC